MSERRSNVKGMVDRLAAEADGDLRRSLRARLGNSQEADEAAQEAFLRLHIAQGRGKVENPRGFLFTIATNLAIDVIRKRRTQSHYVQTVKGSADGGSTADRGGSPEQLLAAKQKLEVAMAVINDLPPRCQHVFLLHRFEDLSYKQIANRLGITKKGVEYHMTQALTRLRKAEL